MEIEIQETQNAQETQTYKITPLPGSEEICPNGSTWQYRGYKIWEGNAYFVYSPSVSGRTGFRRKCWIVQRPNRSRLILSCQPNEVEKKIDGEFGGNGGNGSNGSGYTEPQQRHQELAEQIESREPEEDVGQRNNRFAIRRGFGKAYRGNVGNVDKKEGDINENDGKMP